MLNFIYNDGGRKAAGYKGLAGDCGARAMAIALDMDYKEAYKLLATENKNCGKAKSARNGIDKDIYSDVLRVLGWSWVSSPKFEGRKAKCSDMPLGTVIARQAGHFVAVVNGVPHDIWDCSHKMVYGYWAKTN
jgi:hypothetical protein